MNGKGDTPRSCFSKQFKDNYGKIDWCQLTPPRLVKRGRRNSDKRARGHLRG